MAWHMTGRFIEACSCKMFCPCWFGPAEPDQGWCSGSVLMDIQQGNSEGIDLSGLKVVFVGDWPGDFFSGNGTACLYIDATANTGQRRELELICTGKKGGPWEAMAGVIATWLPAQPATIEVQWGESVSVRVGDIGQISLQPPLTDGAGRQTQVLGAAAMAALQLDRLTLARSDGTAFSDPQMRQWQSGGSGDTSTFNWRA
jgi:hypothetical protein